VERRIWGEELILAVEEGSGMLGRTRVGMGRRAFLSLGAGRSPF
jgi:hypothetical protein